MRSNFAAVPLASLAHIEMGQSPDSAAVREGDREGMPFLQGNAEFGTLHPTPRFSCKAPMKMCRAGDILVSVRAPVGAMNIADRDYCIGRGLAAVRVAGMSSTLAAHVVRVAMPALRRVAQGTTFESVNKSDLTALAVMVPPPEDREPLARTLDTLDTTIRQTEAIIEKLKQVKHGLLHDLLTRGIDENGELRPPQSEAPQLYKRSVLGSTPNDWDVVDLGSLIDGSPRNGIYKPAGDIGAGTLLIGQTAFTVDGSIDTMNARRARVTAAELKVHGLQREDILVSRVFATREGVGQPVVVPELEESAVYESNMMRIRVRQHTIAPHLLFHWLKQRAARAWIMSRAFASNQASINRSAICSVPVPLPPFDEQERILAVINAQVQREQEEGLALSKARELKSGLMDDLLTGRVRVTPLLNSDAATA